MNKNERICFYNFSIETRIDDIDLPNKIKDKINSLGLHPNPEKAYSFNVYFSVEIYADSEFYNFPVEKKKNVNKRKKNAEDTKKDIMYDVLTQQLYNICDALKPLNFNFYSSSITGDELNKDINLVSFYIFEDNDKEKASKMNAHVISPNIQATIDRFIETFEKITKNREKEEQLKIQEKSQHTPNMKSTKEIFTTLAAAILKDHPNKSLSPEKLAREMILEAQIVCDWPLEIRGYTNSSNKPQTIIEEQFDCPEFLVYVKHTSYWVLSKAQSLETVKDRVLYNYKQKSVEQVIVLHNLKNVKFKLFAENKGEIEPISKKEANTAKKLLLSWGKSKK